MAKATPGYVGADLASLTSTAGINAVKRIFQVLSLTGDVGHGARTLPELDALMAVDSEDLTPNNSIVPSEGQPPASSIVHFLMAHPDPLVQEQLDPLCVTFADFTAALKQVQPSAKREGFATVPDVTWADIGALHATREELHMAIVQPIRRPELFSAVGISAACGVLLWGPPGLRKDFTRESRCERVTSQLYQCEGT